MLACLTLPSFENPPVNNLVLIPAFLLNLCKDLIYGRTDVVVRDRHLHDVAELDRLLFRVQRDVFVSGGLYERDRVLIRGCCLK